MTKNQVKGKSGKVTGKRKFRMRKRARRTTASLLLVSALVISLVPTQRKTEAYVNPNTNVLALYNDDNPSDTETVVKKYPYVTESDTSVPAADTTYYAFPIGSEIKDGMGSDARTYYVIDSSAMTEKEPVPVFEMGEVELSADTNFSPGRYNSLKKYLGYATNSNMPTIDLTNGVCYNDSSPSDIPEYTSKVESDNEYGYEFRKFALAYADPEVPDPFGNNYKLGKLTIKYMRLKEPVADPESEEEPTPLDPSLEENWEETGAEDTQYVCTKHHNIAIICDKAFENRAEIETIKMPEAMLYKIGNYAFRRCSGLKSIDIGNKVNSIGYMAFAGCRSLKDLVIKDCVTLATIGDGAFAECGFDSVTLPYHDGLKIGSGAFYGCESLDDATNTMFSRFNEKGGGAITIGPYAFANCGSLTRMEMYKDLQNTGNGYPDYEGLFAGDDSLAKVTLPANYGKGNKTSSPKTLGQYMFQGCNSLEELEFNQDNGRDAQPYDDWQFVTDATIENAKKSNSSYDQATVPSGFFITGPNPYPASNEAAAHESAVKYSNVYHYRDEFGNDIYELKQVGYVFNFTPGGVINSIIPTDEADSELTIPRQIAKWPITRIAASAYDPNKNGYGDKLKKLTIQDNIMEVGTGAFKNADGLEELYIQTKGLNLGNSAFEDCDELVYVEFKQTEGAGATQIGDDCFRTCRNLMEVDFMDDDISSDEIIPVNVTSIGTDAFKTYRDTPFKDSDINTVAKSRNIPINRLGSSENSLNDTDLWLIMKGSPEGYPYRFALGLDSETKGGNIVSSKDNSYITFTTGNYWTNDTDKLNYGNVSAVYNGNKLNGEVGPTLLTYPTENTQVGWRKDDSGNLTDPYTIKDVVDRGANGYKLSTTEVQVIDSAKNIRVPAGIEHIDQTHNTLDSSDKYLRGIEGDLDVYGKYVNTITLNLSKLPSEEGLFQDDLYLSSVTFKQDIKDMGTSPFLFKLDNYPWKEGGTPDSSLQNVIFEGDAMVGKESGTSNNPYYWCDNGIIYSYDGTDTVLEEVLYGRGNPLLDNISQNVVSVKNDPELANVTKIREKAFMNCPYLIKVDLSSAQKLKTIPTDCFANDSRIKQIKLPESVNSIDSGAFYGLDDFYEVWIYGKEVGISPTAFDKTKNPTAYVYEGSAAEDQVKRSGIDYEYIDGRCRVKFWAVNEQGVPQIVLVDGQEVQLADLHGKVDVPEAPVREGYKFIGWESDNGSTVKDILEDPTNFYARYEPDSSSSSSSSSSTGSSSDSTSTSTTQSTTKSTTSTTGSTTSQSTTSGSSSTDRSSSSSSSSNSSSSTGSSSSGSSSNSSTLNSSTVPIVISGYASSPGAAAGTIGGAAGNGAGGGNTATTGGRTNVVSSAKGITDTGKMSARVNGSSDNYVVKISETQEANDSAQAALTKEFGSLDNIRYLPMDISLYDSTGTTKISPVPAGVTVSVTIPIPDDLVIYGGNNKIGSTAGGSLEKMAPRFTVINSVPCMTFTASHFSPYVVYVDTANLTEAGVLDSTPKTADPIHPKWFLVTGLIASALFMFLKRDPEEAAAAA